MEKVQLLYKRLTDTAKPPVRQHPDDAGLDLFVDEVEVPDLSFYPYVAVFKSNIAFCVATPGIYCLDARARSSIYKRFMVVCNGVGTVDVGYRGSVNMACYCLDSRANLYEKGERFMQILLPGTIDPRSIELIEVDELPEGTRGANGFGSTGV